MSKIIALTLSIAFAISITVTSSFAQLDPSFGSGGRFIRVFDGGETVVKSFLLPDGKFLVVTNNTSGGNQWPVTYHFVKFNQDGTTDLTYGTNGSIQLPIPFVATGFLNYGINDAIRQPDGKIVLAGYDNPNGLVLRFNENGTLDNSFSDDGIHRPNIDQADNDVVSRVIYQSDGKLLVAGHPNVNGSNRMFLIRYESNGTLDFNFGNQAGFIVHQIPVVSIVGLDRQSNGSYVALSRGWSGAPTLVGKVYRFATDGSVDGSFSSPEFGDNDALKLVRLSDDRLIVGGNPYNFFPPDALFRFHNDIRLTRLNANGGVDGTFGSGGSVRIDAVSGALDELADVVELTDGSLAIASTTIISKNRSVVAGPQMTSLKLTASGTLTGRYLVSDLLGDGRTTSLVRQPDGKLVLVGSYGPWLGTNIVLARMIDVPFTTPRFRGIPFEFSSSSSGPFGISHMAVFRPSNATWYASPLLSGGVQFGTATSVLVAGDYFGDYQTELAVFHPNNGTWLIARSYGGAASTFIWGQNGDIPVQYDYDGDGKYDVAVFRPSEGNWYIRQSGGGVQIHHWGLSGDRPVTGDYDGDGLGDLAVWRGFDGVWYIHRSSDGQAMIAGFGLGGDIPVQEDYDGDLKTDLAIFRPSTGVWYIWRSSDNGFTIVPFGTSGDVPVPADYDGDRKMDIAVFRPSESKWYRINSSNGAIEQAAWGIAGDIAVQGIY